jgi:hypothetical protein|nr:MAG TPA: hypothetical protein [Bacteriophage sp.]
MSIIGDQTQRTDLDGGFRKKLARRICQMVDLKILVMKLWLGLECLSHIERKCMNLREILPHLSGEMSRDAELLKETAKQGDTVVLNVKTPDGTLVTVNAVIKAKYPHVVHMQYQTAKGYVVNTSFAWKKLLMIMLNPNNIEDNEEGE